MRVVKKVQGKPDILFTKPDHTKTQHLLPETIPSNGSSEEGEPTFPSIHLTFALFCWE